MQEDRFYRSSSTMWPDPAIGVNHQFQPPPSSQPPNGGLTPPYAPVNPGEMLTSPGQSIGGLDTTFESTNIGLQQLNRTLYRVSPTPVTNMSSTSPYACVISHPVSPTGCAGWSAGSTPVGTRHTNVPRGASIGANQVAARLSHLSPGLRPSPKSPDQPPSAPLSQPFSASALQYSTLGTINYTQQETCAQDALSPTVSPIQHPTSLNLFPRSEQIQQELAANSRRWVRWQNWEHNIILNKFIGPDAPQDRPTACCLA
ncbi:hypothetical protein CTheo_8640 [Ceratobasidium theobromae]|uniref:Uncharacterized protein n=1 Tax=Ceratobasidium theobromae TaxID=1582974 RepID=A0A5N5Q8B1_9AGAM|nr:hypothetical protein CTheo_8640 [Ceratobasidium theobromae]